METRNAATPATLEGRVTAPFLGPGHTRPRLTEARASLASRSAALLAHAVRRVVARWRESSAGLHHDITPILEAAALTVERGDPAFVEALSPRPPLRLSLHLVDMLEDELLALWPSGDGSATQILQAVSRLRLARSALERRSQQLPGAPLVGIDGLEFLLEFVHDMRSPLSSVQLLADRLVEGLSGPLTPLQLRQLRLIYRAAHALNTVTSNALQLARAGDQLEEPEAHPFSVTRLLADVQDAVRALADQKGLQVTFIRPDADRRSGHPIELHRILLNLVTNALKFTRVGSITVTATDLANNQVEFAVQDSGPGIPASAQQTLFQPFRRSDGGERAIFSATGLGLAITQRLVHALGGRLNYETGPELGTRFFFVLDLPPA